MSHSNSTRAVVIALLGNTMIAILKFIAAFFTQSASMSAEAIQSRVRWKPLNTYQNINANAYNTEDMMSIPTSITRSAVVEEIELMELV